MTPVPDHVPAASTAAAMAPSLTRGVRDAATHWPEALAMVHGVHRFDWSQFSLRIARLAAVFRRAGVCNGERVGILGQNSHRHVESMYASQWAGGIAVPLNWRLADAELLATLQDCEPTVLVVDREFASAAARIASAVGSIRAVLVEDCDALEPDIRALLGASAVVHDHETALQLESPMPDAGRCGDDIACLIYTGGTTGRAKGVMLSHANLCANVVNVRRVLPFDERTVHLHCGALFHLSAVWRVFAITLCGGTHVVLPRFVAADVLATIRDERIDAAAFVPTMIAALLALPDFTAEAMRSLKVITYGASPVSQSLLEHLMQALPQCGLYQGYGMTETSPAVTFLLPDQHYWGNPRLRSAGRPIDGVDVRVADANDAALVPGAIGEIQVSGATVMQGYWRQPELTAATLRGGWMHTGDAGYLDEDGYLFIVDRLKDMVVTGGENVYSSEVENALAAHPGVAECAVFGIPDERWGEAVHAVVVPRVGAVLDEALLRAHCRTLIADYKCPKSIELRTQPLPLSAVNKVLKASLRAPWWAGRERRVG